MPHPTRPVTRRESLRLERAADHRPALGQRRDRAGREHLHQQVSGRGGLDGAGNHRPAGGIRCELRQKPVLRAPPTMCTTATRRPVSSSSISSVRRYFNARLSNTIRATVPRSGGTGWPVREQSALMRAGISPGVAKSRASISIDAVNARAAAAARRSRSRRAARPPAPRSAGTPG